MYGDTIGALRVYFKQETESTAKLMFNKEGNQGNQWINGIFRLPETDINFQVKFDIIYESIYGSLLFNCLSLLKNDLPCRNYLIWPMCGFKFRNDQGLVRVIVPDVVLMGRGVSFSVRRRPIGAMAKFLHGLF